MRSLNMPTATAVVNYLNNAALCGKPKEIDMLNRCKGGYEVSDPDTGATADVWTREDGSWSIWSVFTPRDGRGKGGAARMMQEITALLDEHGVEAHLGAKAFQRYEILGEPAVEPSLTTPELAKFYAKFGFVVHHENYGEIHMRRPAKGA
jgi:GNAT superfamily N-acetyltransferase